jgi:pyruvate dehydrogenase kinase 2/3/4
MAAAKPAMATLSRLAGSVLGSTAKQGVRLAVRLADHFPKEVVDDIFAGALKKQTGVSLKYM